MSMHTANSNDWSVSESVSGELSFACEQYLASSVRGIIATALHVCALSPMFYFLVLGMSFLFTLNSHCNKATASFCGSDISKTDVLLDVQCTYPN